MSLLLRNFGQIQFLAQRAKEQLRKGNLSSAHHLISLLAKVERQELQLLKKKTNSAQLCAQAKKAYELIQRYNPKKTSSSQLETILNEIIALQQHEKDLFRQTKQGLSEQVLATIDPYIRSLIQQLNTLAFVKKTHYSCQGKNPANGNAYLIIEYESNIDDALQHQKLRFHRRLEKIAEKASDSPKKQNKINYLFGFTQTSWDKFISHFDSDENILRGVKELYVNRWNKLARLVEKYKQKDNPRYTRQSIRLDKDSFRLNH